MGRSSGKPQFEDPLPQLSGVGEVARVAVGVPALHDAVLDNDGDAPFAGVVAPGATFPLSPPASTSSGK
jgi:hypothetical protein